MDMGITFFSLRRYEEAEKEFQIAAKAKDPTIKKSAAYWLEKVHYELQAIEIDKAAGRIRKLGPIFP
jgi:tetratricopeptide (TPR) repeat protein